MNLEKIFDFLSRAFNYLQQEGERMQDNIDFRERCRARGMDDDALMHDYEQLSNYDGESYQVKSRRENVSKELRRREYDVE